MLKLMILRLKKLKLKPIIVATVKTKTKIIKFCKSNNITYFKGSEKNVLSRYYLAAKNLNLKKLYDLPQIAH